MQQLGVKAVSILVADDHPLTRSGVRHVLETRKGWRVSEASNGAEVLKALSKVQPDVVILDLSMPGVDGLSTTSRIRRTTPELPVLILTMHDDRAFIHEALKTGARGYVLKSDSDKELLMAIESLLDGRTFFSRATSQAVLEYFQQVRTKKAQNSPSQDQGLSLHDREIVQLLAAGKSNKEVAARFHISMRTAEYHRARIMRKLGLRSFSELVVFAVRNRIAEDTSASGP